jgi:uncharacterized protein (DUF433 family)
MILEADHLPLQTDDTGTIRVANTRITLNVLLALYNQRQSAEDLQESFPTLSLADIHSVIGYYLRHRAAIDQYLTSTQSAADQLRTQIEGLPGHKDFRERLIARKAANGTSQST